MELNTAFTAKKISSLMNMATALNAIFFGMTIMQSMEME